MPKVDYTKNEIVDALYRVGIKEKDNLFIHNNIGFFGRMEGVATANDLCEGFIDSLKRVVSPEGTIVFPTFSYSFCHGELYNPATTKSDCGLLSTYSYLHAGFRRSLDPNFSIAAWGNNTDLYCKKPAHESFGQGSFWERMLSTGGKIVCMNFDCGSTFVHYVERACSVSYRYNKAFNGMIEVDGTIYRDYAVHFVSDGGKDDAFFGRLDKKCREKKICKVQNLGKGTLLAMDIQEYYAFIVDTLKSEPRFLTVGG